ncbi:MAG TPA: hypothetical protein VKA84_09485 [Gemmatimonadaceae bacterium]|nr:hypothetical protein [Gemmatimonadaceae bacterium]
MYFAGAMRASGEPPTVFRLPVPPKLDEVRAAAWAIERRAKRAYFAALDAMRTGQVDPEQAAKLDRLLAEATTPAAQAVLGHLKRVMDAAVREGQTEPLLPPPPVAFDSIVATSTDASVAAEADPTGRLAWPLEWLRTRGYVAGGKSLEYRWEAPAAASPPSPAGADAPAASR